MNFTPLFSQRNGHAELPPQLKLGEISTDLRQQIAYYITLEIERSVRPAGLGGVIFGPEWRRVAADLHVLFFKHAPHTLDRDVERCRGVLHRFIYAEPFSSVFDLVEFLIQNPRCSETLTEDLSTAFINTRAAYRIVDEQVVAVGNEEMATTYVAAVATAEENGFGASKTHLVNAGAALRRGDWSGSARESIHAVEAMVVRLAPNRPTLGKALNELEKNGLLIHNGLKTAFSALYGYSSDQEGIRHALVFADEASVDEIDALFMLGACSAFVSYLVARTTYQKG